jgi:hypothetical protein
VNQLDHIPTVEEAKAAVYPGLYESYWWVTGWNFNRPVMAKVGVAVRMNGGPYVWVEMGGNCPPFGYKATDLTGINFTFYGPIPLPKQLLIH